MVEGALCALALGMLGTARARAEPDATATVAFQRELKRLEYELIHQGAGAELEDSTRGWTADRHLTPARRPSLTRSNRGAPAAAGVRARARHATGVHQERARDQLEPGGPQGARRSPRPRGEGGTAAPVNHPINDRSLDLSAGSTQAEVSIAAFGNQLVSAWNDVEEEGTGNLGFGWSADGGATWIDGGGLPLGPGLLRWVSDPAVTVNERTGEFYAAGMAIVQGEAGGGQARPRSAIGVVRGRFENGALTWSEPVVARAVRDTLP